MKKLRDLLIVASVYVLAYVIGFVSCLWIENLLWKLCFFDLVATLITFAFSLIFKNSSVYDPYWSLTPMVMSIWLFIVCKAFSFWQILFLIVFNLWSVRLTINWITTFTDFSYEDWRYRKYRAENKGIMWFIINFCGIHMVPTIVVFLGMLPLFEIAVNKMNALCLIGIAVILFGIAMEFFADRQMHAFLRETEEKITCKKGLWRYSRHPNYLGEISIWLGVYLTMLPFALDRWYYIIGFISIAVLFNVVSIPLMEKRQMARRSDYGQYKKETSRLFLLPAKH